MATLDFTVDEDINNAFSSTTLQTTWFREGFVGLINGIIDAGGVHVLSCSGAATSTSADQVLANPTTFTAGTLAGVTQPGAYVVYQLGTSYIYLSANSSALTPTVMASLAIYVSTATYTLASNPTYTRPVTAGVETAVLTLSQFIPSVLGAGSWGYTASATENQMVFYVKRDGADDVITWIAIHRANVTPTADASADGMPFGLVVGGAVAGLTVAAIQTTSNWRGHQADGTTAFSTATVLSHGWSFTSWTSGQAADLRGRLFPVVLGNNSATTSAARYYGTMRLIQGIPPATPANSTDPTDPALDLAHWQSLGDIALFILKASGAFT